MSSLQYVAHMIHSDEFTMPKSTIRVCTNRIPLNTVWGGRCEGARIEALTPLQCATMFVTKQTYLARWRHELESKRLHSRQHHSHGGNQVTKDDRLKMEESQHTHTLTTRTHTDRVPVSKKFMHEALVKPTCQRF